MNRPERYALSEHSPALSPDGGEGEDLRCGSVRGLNACPKLEVEVLRVYGGLSGRAERSIPQNNQFTPDLFYFGKESSIAEEAPSLRLDENGCGAIKRVF
jgi:hypothetical protein